MLKPHTTYLFDMSQEDVSMIPEDESCDRCDLRKVSPLLGHDKCSRHRDCFSHTQDGSTIYAWYPEDCQKCKDIVSGYHGLKKAQKDSVLLDLKEMLKGMRQVAASYGYCDIWEYHNKLSTFFGTQTLRVSSQRSSQGSPPETVFSGFSNNPENITPEESSATNNIPATSSATPVCTDQRQETTQRNIQPLQNTVNSMPKDLTKFIKDVVKDIFRNDNNHLLEQDCRHVSRREYFDHNKSSRQEAHRRSNSDRSRSTHSPDSHRSRSRSRSPLEAKGILEPRTGFTWYDFDDRAVKRTGQVEIKGTRIDIILNTDGKRFRIHHDSSGSHSAPYMSKNQAQSVLTGSLEGTVYNSDNPGLGRKALRMHLNDSSGTAQTLETLDNDMPKLLHAVYNDGSKIYDSINKNVFSPIISVYFDSGWSLSDASHLDFAKFTPIDLDKASLDLGIRWRPVVPQQFLDDEKCYRSRVVTAISVLALYDKKIDLAKSQGGGRPAGSSFRYNPSNYLEALRPRLGQG